MQTCCIQAIIMFTSPFANACSFPKLIWSVDWSESFVINFYCWCCGLYHNYSFMFWDGALLLFWFLYMFPKWLLFGGNKRTNWNEITAIQMLDYILYCSNNSLVWANNFTEIHFIKCKIDKIVIFNEIAKPKLI